jgi:hypothetical protein
MADAIANGGAGLVCTTCHNEGHPPHEVDPHVDATGMQSASCVEADCHGSGSILTVHSEVGCICHADPDLAGTMEALIAAGTAECIDCHIPRQTLHEPPHVPIAPESADTTNTACINDACHSASLVTAHNGGECSASCHYFEPEWPQACRCHATAVTRPTGPLATTMADAIANGGAGLVCTTCHNEGHPPHEVDPHVDATGTQSASCVEADCHGSGSILTVHSEVGCICHADPDLAGTMEALIAAGTAECIDCHIPRQTLHEPPHVPIAPESADLTNTACVTAGCHSASLVTAHNGGECSASCHYFEEPWPQACRCHATAVTRPTGPLATTMADAIANGGAGLVCTTCHNEGHPAHEDTHGDASGTQSAHCTSCHGSTDLPVVMGSCFCHTDPAMAGTIAAFVDAGTYAECLDCHIPADCPDPGAVVPPTATGTLLSSSIPTATTTAETSETAAPAQELAETVKHVPTVPAPECSLEGTSEPGQPVCLTCHPMAP